MFVYCVYLDFLLLIYLSRIISWPESENVSERIPAISTALLDAHTYLRIFEYTKEDYNNYDRKYGSDRNSNYHTNFIHICSEFLVFGHTLSKCLMSKLRIKRFITTRVNTAQLW